MFGSIYKTVCRGELYIAITALISCVSLIFIAAVMRSFDHPINWGTDIALLLFAWSVFLGADIAYRNNAAVLVDIVVKLLPAAAARALNFLCYLIVLAFMFAMVYLGIKLCIVSRARTFQGIPGFSFSWVTLSVPTAFFLMIITTLRKMYYEFILKTDAPILDAGEAD